MNRTQILTRPSPNIRALLFPDTKQTFIEDDLIFFPLGRDALINGLKLLNIDNNAAIIIPAYMCESTIAPLRAAGYRLIFIDIGEDLNFSIDLISAAIKKYNVQAVLTVHYFGFPSNIKVLVKICSSLNVKVIEDCSHSFLTKIGDHRVGCFGDIAIFSMRKNLPTYDGGALRINKPVSNNYEVIDRHGRKLWGGAYLLIRIVEYIIFLLGWPNIYSQRIDEFKKKFKKNNSSVKFIFTNDRQIESVSPSFQLYRYLGNQEYLSRLESQVIVNFNRIIAGAIKLGFEPLYSKSPPGCVPQWAIIYDKKGGLLAWMRDNGVGASRWPWYEMPNEVKKRVSKYSVTHDLDQHLVMLPIHQSVGYKQCEKILKILETWSLR